MRLILKILILIIFPIRTFACECPIYTVFETKDDLKEYDFIAYIKITDIQKAGNNTDLIIHQISFDIINLYKGPKLKNILVDGSHSSLIDIGRTNCDLEENVGDEWVIFGFKNSDLNQYITGYCTRSQKIKDFTGEIYKHGNEVNLTSRLKTLFDEAPCKE